MSVGKVVVLSLSCILLVAGDAAALGIEHGVKTEATVSVQTPIGEDGGPVQTELQTRIASGHLGRVWWSADVGTDYVRADICRDPSDPSTDEALRIAEDPSAYLWGPETKPSECRDAGSKDTRVGQTSTPNPRSLPGTTNAIGAGAFRDTDIDAVHADVPGVPLTASSPVDTRHQVPAAVVPTTLVGQERPEVPASPADEGHTSLATEDEEPAGAPRHFLRQLLPSVSLGDMVPTGFSLATEVVYGAPTEGHEDSPTTIIDEARARVEYCYQRYVDEEPECDDADLDPSDPFAPAPQDLPEGDVAYAGSLQQDAGHGRLETQQGAPGNSASVRPNNDETNSGTPRGRTSTPPTPQASVSTQSVSSWDTGAAAWVASASVAAAFVLWRLALVTTALFSRIKRDKALEHPMRQLLWELIQERPGLHYMAVVREVRASRSVVLHHLRKLVQVELVQEKRSGKNILYYARGGLCRNQVAALSAVTSAPALRVLEEIQRSPGTTQRRVADALGVSNSTLSYHIKRLSRDGIVDIVASGNRNRLFPNERTGMALQLNPAA